jgi:DNA gyrase/topoisomerase IV subunit B
MVEKKYVDSSIISLEGLDHIRHRSGMYGVDQYTKQGIYLLIKEIIDNSVDEARMDPNNKHIIKLCFIKKRKTFQVVVQDNGRGVPLRMMEPIFTKPGTSGKWEDLYDSSGGTHGVGAKATVAMSKMFCAVSSRASEGRAILSLKDGKVTHSKISKSKKVLSSGVIVAFEPDENLMQNVSDFFEPDNAYDDLRSLMEFISVFVPNIVFEIYSNTTPIDYKEFLDTPENTFNNLSGKFFDLIGTTEHVAEPESYLLKQVGCNSRIIWNSGKIKQEPIHVNISSPVGNLDKSNTKDLTKKMSYEVQFFLTSDFNSKASGILGAVNMININDKKSVHIYGLENAIKNKLLNFIDDKYKDFFLSYYSLPLHLISIVDWQHATFTGQHKHRFTNNDFLKGFERSLLKLFNEKDIDYWGELFLELEEDIRVKFEKRNKIDLNLNGPDKNLAFELNTLGCYYECKSSDKDLTELIICEGGSAGGWIKQGRDINTQAIFLLKGKPVNVLQMGFNTAMKNKIFNDFVRVLGTSPNDTELNDLRFGKIVILTDADLVLY